MTKYKKTIFDISTNTNISSLYRNLIKTQINNVDIQNTFTISFPKEDRKFTFAQFNKFMQKSTRLLSNNRDLIRSVFREVSINLQMTSLPTKVSIHNRSCTIMFTKIDMFNAEFVLTDSNSFADVVIATMMAQAFCFETINSTNI